MLLLPLPWFADAAGLGRLTVLSSFGQPFNAEINLESRQDELSTLSSRLASLDVYKQADLDYGPALSDLRFSIKTQPSRQPYIEVTSSRPVNELFIHLLIELTGGTTRIIRRYTALIDPPAWGPMPVTSAPPAVRSVQPAADTPGAVRRRMATRVEEKTPATRTKDVARLSKREPPRAIATDSGETPDLLRRIQALEEKSILQSNALAALMKRIALLEKAGQALRNVPETGNPGIAVAPGRPATEPPPPTAAAAKSEVVAEAKQNEASIAARTEGPNIVSPAEKPAAQAMPEKRKTAAVTPAKSNSTSALTPERLFLAAAGGAILLGGFAFWLWRRRQLQPVTPADMLNKLLTRDPSREDVQIKLLEFFAARNDKEAFHRAASGYKELVGDQGEAWLKVAAMGYALDPGNPLYEAGKHATPAGTNMNEAGRT